MTSTPSTTASHDAGPPIPELIGSSAAMQEVYRLVRRVAPTSAAVLLLGQQGTGKQLVARAIHRLSTRSSGPLVWVNCGEYPHQRLEDVLFGDAGAAAGGGDGHRPGCFKDARGGTLLLVEIDTIGPRLQARLLRALGQQKTESGDEAEPAGIDLRVIAASSRDLLELVEAGRFREDLYYRLAVVTVALPPLGERREDIPRLVEHFLEVYGRQNNRPVLQPRLEAAEALKAYDWPGNVGELRSYIHRAVVLAEGEELTCELLPEVVLGGRPRSAGRYRAADPEALAAELVQQGIDTAGPQAQDLHAAIVNRVERELIVQVMAACEGVQTKAAARLGINRNTLHKKLKQYGLEK
jgi:DNA-binding NtrC family response regulator